MMFKIACAKLVAAAAVAMALAVPARAADLPARPYVKGPIPLLYNWTGFYIGAHFGASFSSETVTPLAALGAMTTNPSGVLGGFQLGYNYQFSPNWLVGVEGEVSFTSATGNASFVTPAAAVTATSNHNWYDTLAARFGFVQNNWMFYAKAGGAWMNADYALASTAVGASNVNATRTGFTVGAGAEYAFSPTWSAKVEYAYLDFGTDTIGFIVPAGLTNIHTEVHEVKFGLNYHFMPGSLFGRW
jgi:outer membrane immunogenic protein